jgi:pimeloyl-ACP methyl ester carboxylesterase
MVLGKFLIGGAASYLGTQQYLARLKLPRDLYYNFEERCAVHGYPVQSYYVTTTDGYILKLFRIQGKGNQFANKPPVLMLHGLTNTANTFIINQATKPPAFRLADEGYDVWLGNSRGNNLSRLHTTFKSDDKKYWDWCVDDIAEKDLPAFIDFVLQNTGRHTLSYIGHSQATHAAFSLLSYKPEYNDKMNLAIMLTPVGGIFNVKAFYLKKMLDARYIRYLESRGANMVADFPGSLEWSKAFYHHPQLAVLFKDRYDYTINNDNPKNSAYYKYWLSGGTSIKNLKYYNQLITRKSPRPYKFDYGAKNQEVYGANSPPCLDYNKITTKIALFAGQHDIVTQPGDVDILRLQLNSSNVVFYKKDYKLDHSGFAMSNQLHHMEDMLSVLKEYSS